MALTNLHLLFSVLALHPLLQTPAPQGARSGERGGEVPILGWLLASGDPKVLAEQKALYGKSRAEFNKAYPADRYRVLSWGDNRLLVVDLDSGPLAKLRDERLLTRAFLERRRDDGTLDVNRFAPAELDAAKSAVGGSWPARPNEPHRPPAFVSMDRLVRVELTLGGQTRTVLLPTDNRAMFEAAKRRFDPQKPFANVSDTATLVRRNETTLRLEGSALRAAS